MQKLNHRGESTDYITSFKCTDLKVQVRDGEEMRLNEELSGGSVSNFLCQKGDESCLGNRSSN